MRSGFAPSITRITASIGAEIDGIDLRVDTHEPTVSLLRSAIAQHHMVVLRGQFLTAEQHAVVARSFGPILTSPVRIATGSAGPAVGEVSTIEDTAERPPAGFPWHTDVSWTAEPPSLGFLSSVMIPGYGGDTIWASTASIFDALSTDEQLRCEQSTIFHAPDVSLLASVARHHGPDAADRLQHQHPGEQHRLVGIHPLTGRKHLFLSPLYAQTISGPASEDCPLLQRLHAMLDDPHNQVRWKWREGDFVIWDETSTCHRALTDHYPQRRIMRRCVTGTS
jgi:taurine dioxygenase